MWNNFNKIKNLKDNTNKINSKMIQVQCYNNLNNKWKMM